MLTTCLSPLTQMGAVLNPLGTPLSQPPTQMPLTKRHQQTNMGILTLTVGMYWSSSTSMEVVLYPLAFSQILEAKRKES